MNADQRRQYEMLLRVRDFGIAHGDRFAASAVGRRAFASLNAAVDALTAAAVSKQAASTSARPDRKRNTRQAVITRLVKASVLARVLRAEGHTLPAFEPLQSKSVQVLLTTARQFARDAEPFDEEFSGHGVGSKDIADAAAALDSASRDRDTNRARYTASRETIRELLMAATLVVRRLDLIVDHTHADSNDLRAVEAGPPRRESAAARHRRSLRRRLSTCRLGRRPDRVCYNRSSWGVRLQPILLWSPALAGCFS